MKRTREVVRRCRKGLTLAGEVEEVEAKRAQRIQRHHQTRLGDVFRECRDPSGPRTAGGEGEEKRRREVMTATEEEALMREI